MIEEDELALVRREAAHLKAQLAEVKRVDDLELDKLWRLAGMRYVAFIVFIGQSSSSS